MQVHWGTACLREVEEQPSRNAIVFASLRCVVVYVCR